MLAVVLMLAVIAAGVFWYTMKNVTDTQSDSNRQLSYTMGTMSSEYMQAQTEKRLQDLASEKAELADGIFLRFRTAVSTVAEVVRQIYSDPSAYAQRPAPLPDPSKNGSLTLQVLYSADCDPEDPAVVEELGLVGNVQDTLASVNKNNDGIASIYFAAETGFMVQADLIPASKYDANGVLMPFEAKDRPWYKGAAASGKAYLTPVTRDAHTPRLAIMCGVPVYADGAFKGVAGGGMYLDDMESLIRGAKIGESGSAVIINQQGQVLFSTVDEGVFAAVADGPDLRKSSNMGLAQVITRAVDRKSGVTPLVIGNESSYVAYAPMETVGWSLVLILPQAEIEAPTQKLLESINLITEDSLNRSAAQAESSAKLLIILSALIVAAAVVVAAVLSRRIVKPIHLLTEKVSSIEGNTLDFQWDLNTGDETQTLAESFRSMTVRMNDYIEDIQKITAEKEKIGTELSLAARIQEAMLPSIFPPYPDRREFDIYASMDPAKEVGGDFYDFFFIDDDHLCLVIADVSGKGIPAALFMTISKITIQNFAKQASSPAEILMHANDTICANNSADMFVTAWVGILEISTGILRTANAGHEYPIIKKPGRPYELVKDPHGCAVGVFEDEKYKEFEVKLEPGSKLFVYTDGAPEAMAPGDVKNMFGLDRLVAALNSDPEASPKETLKIVSEAIAGFVQNEEQFDDLTMLSFEYRGDAGA